MNPFGSKNHKICFDAKIRYNITVLGPYLQISFCTDFEALSDDVKHLITYIVKCEKNVQKRQISFSCFYTCYTSKHLSKQTPSNSPFNFVLSLLEQICLKVNAAIAMPQKPDS